MLLEKVDLLNNQVNTLEEINKLNEITDSLRREEVDNLTAFCEDSNKKYNRLKKGYNIYKTISISSLLTLLLTLICR